MTIIFKFLLLFQIFVISLTQQLEREIEQLVIACHTTDFICFKRQYQLLRDHFLLGNKQVDIPGYEPHTFHYSDSGTCIKITGVEESELLAINYDGVNKKFSVSLTMPMRLHQVDFVNTTGIENRTCAQPDTEFDQVGLHAGQLKKFSGNATVEVTYPLRLHKKKSKHYMLLEDEDLDVILDVPDLSQYDKDSALERKLFEWSEWAYEVVQHVDIAEHTIAPFTDQIKRLFGILPLEMFILLYPSEDYADLQFSYADEDSVSQRV